MNHPSAPAAPDDPREDDDAAAPGPARHVPAGVGGLLAGCAALTVAKTSLHVVWRIPAEAMPPGSR
ncbi:hypothetical protein [Streptomyces antimycoticus]|uniref:hypothetical protein n=1 Tax=Streptomyces antimycoticus TaxID=68175 RepID=UPI0010F99F40|nr:hypothetical protein [Streptomyces antimycoticus]